MIQAIETFRFREAQFQMLNLARLGNKFLAETEPWKLAKEDMEAVGCILNYALTLLGNIAIAGEPFLPDGMASIMKQLNAASLKNDWTSLWTEGKLIKTVSAGHQLHAAELLYKNVEDEEIQKQVDKLNKVKEAKANEPKPVAPVKANIVFDDFAKLDIRIGTILTAEKMEKSNKLLKLKVEAGTDQRTILSGIAQHFTPEELIGKQVTFVANLEPRKMMGIESQGMILMTEDAQGKLQLIQPGETVAPGAQVS